MLLTSRSSGSAVRPPDAVPRFDQGLVHAVRLREPTATHQRLDAHDTPLNSVVARPDIRTHNDRPSRRPVRTPPASGSHRRGCTGPQPYTTGGERTTRLVSWLRPEPLFGLGTIDVSATLVVAITTSDTTETNTATPTTDDPREPPTREHYQRRSPGAPSHRAVQSAARRATVTCAIYAYHTGPGRGPFPAPVVRPVAGRWRSPSQYNAVTTRSTATTPTPFNAPPGRSRES